ncbi:MAG: CDP-alcohol phosphatidyltransferase family protein [Thermovibrio sp.]|nr:MAG: CDP-alcohol phosphatidyltransferase family protein [Thermovibrio sp.]
MISSSGIKEKAQEILRPFAVGIGSLGVSPNTVTVLGFLLSALSGYLLSEGNLLGGALSLALSGFCDVLDGIIARTMRSSSKVGAFLDSFLDRYSDFFPLAGLTYFGHTTNSDLIIVSALFSLVGSFSTSYARARAESLGIDCKKGLFERPERVILLILGLLTGYIGETLLILALFSNLTAVQRLNCVLRSSR